MSKLTREELSTWLEAITKGTYKGEPVTDENSKDIDKIGAKEVKLEEATLIAKALNEVSTQEILGVMDNMWNSIDLVMIILKDELGITDEQAEKASKKVREKREAYFAEKQKELEEQQKKQAEEQDKEKSSDKVVEMKSKND